MKPIIIIIFMALAACVGNAGGAGEYTANRMPGTNLMWTAGRTAAEIAAAAETNAAALASATNALTAALASATNALTAALAGEAELRVSGTNDLYAAITNEAALRVSGTNALHVEISGATAAASAATNQSASALAISQSATNTAATALALGVTATNAAAGANALAGTATNTAATALALGVTATNDAANAVYQAGIAYLFATNAAAEVAGVYTPATNAAAVSAAAWTRANLSYTLAGSVYATSTNAIDIATNAAAQVATAYPAATNALAQATNATAVSAAAYVLASNAWDTATNAYDIATNAQQRAGYLETNAATKAELGNYETVQDANIVAALAIDAQLLAEGAVQDTDARYLAALTNEQDLAALAALAVYGATNQVTRWYGTESTNTWAELEGGTNVVIYESIIRDSVLTNYYVTAVEGLASDGVAANWTTRKLPFSSSDYSDGWSGGVTIELDEGNLLYTFDVAHTNGGFWRWRNILPEFPVTLAAQGETPPMTGWVVASQEISFNATNEIFRVDIAALTNAACHATTQYVAQAISDIPAPDLSAKLDKDNGTASNLTVNGFIALPQTAPTNLVLRLVCSNEHIYVEEVYP